MFFSKKHYLSVIAIFKNEGHILNEWITHYLNEGVDHFYLIDNGSTDDYEEKIISHIKNERVTLIKDDRKWAQEELYNQYFLPKRRHNTWFMICDLDEFIYARNGYTTISSFLRSLPKRVGMVQIPWKLFGSSGHIDQPKDVVNHFLRRARYNGKNIPGADYPNKNLSKSIVRCSSLKKIFIHRCGIKKRYQTIHATKDLLFHESSVKASYVPCNEELLQSSFLQLNHYAIQSYNWFMNVKVKRGAADAKNHQNDRNTTYFNTYDEASNDLEDTELSKKWL